MNKKRNIALVVQRYGKEINGGAEQHCRQLALHLAKHHQVTIYTTCAEDYQSWSNAYPAGESWEDGICIRRFPVVCQRGAFSGDWPCAEYGYPAEVNWMMQQGPISFSLVRALSYARGEFDVFLFFTYLYFTTWAGLGMVPEKSILIPTAHDEPPIYQSIFQQVFHLPRGIFYNTLEEQEFVHKVFHNAYIPHRIGGVGVELPQDISAQRFREKYSITSPFLLYVGRITEQKGCKQLFEYFSRYTEQNQKISLVLLGKEHMPIPECATSLGFVSEEDKFDAMAACHALINPSFFESLSMVLLEAMALGKTVLVNGKCEVLKAHCQRSDAGLYYENYEEFAACMDVLFSEEPPRFDVLAKRYVQEQYGWDGILDRLEQLMEEIVCG